MFKFTKISIILLLICSIEANKTIELLEKLINQQKEEFDYRLNNVIKVQEIYERRIEELMKQTSDFNEKRNDINSRSCYSNEIRYNTSESYINSINFIYNSIKILIMYFITELCFQPSE
jgi:hypothetical protein